MVVISIDVDTTAARAKIDSLMKMADAQVKSWKLKRDEVIRSIRTGMTLISSFVSSARMALSLVGQQIDPFFSSLIAMVMSTVSMMLSISSAVSVTILGAPIGAIMAGAAIGLNVLTTAKLIADQAKITNNFEGIRTSLDKLGANVARGGTLIPGGGSL